MVTYKGIRTCQGNRVYKDNDYFSLDKSLEYENHSPTGFNWGYGGSGPAQLALALLLDVTNSVETAFSHYMNFKWGVVAKFSHKGFVITDTEIRKWLSRQS